MRITLLGLEFASANMGCAALAYSFADEVSKISKKIEKNVEYSAVVFDVGSNIEVPYTKQKIDCLKIRYKSVSFWKNLIKLFKSSDLIVDFTGGDSFSDIYGKKRFYMATIIKMLAIRSRTPFVLGPQTYGPYQRKLVKKFAKWVLKKSTYVFARDEVSRKFATELSGRKVEIAPDVAFALSYEKKEKKVSNQKIQIGLNVSGLLWNGGYSHSKLPLTVDYRMYCKELLKKLSQNEAYEIHLITHVGRNDESIAEGDYAVCRQLHKKFKNTVLPDVFQSPIDAKTYISGMDILIGARMHATIASFSTYTATIPFSYSRKFEGLYNSVGYDYVIHACSQTTVEALDKTLEYIGNYQVLKEQVADSMKQVEKLQDNFEEKLKKILIQVSDRKVKG